MNQSDETLTNPILLDDFDKQPLDVKELRNKQKLTSKHKKVAERLKEVYDLKQSFIYP